MVKYERKILQISKIKEIDMKTLIVTGGSLDISWAKDFVRTINAEYIIAADRFVLSRRCQAGGTRTCAGYDTGGL